MGSLTFPVSGVVYADTQIFIYSVEKHPIYSPLLRPLWCDVQSGRVEMVSSELAMMETLVAPLKNGDQALVSTYEQLFQLAGIRLLPITKAVLRAAARLRAAGPSRRAARRHSFTRLLSMFFDQ